MADVVRIDVNGRRFNVFKQDRGKWILVIGDCLRCGDRVCRVEFSKVAIEDVIDPRLFTWRIQDELERHDCQPDFTGEARPPTP